MIPGLIPWLIFYFEMTYITLNFYIFVIAALIIYYGLPLKIRWVALLCADIAFYALFYKEGWYILLVTILISFLAGFLMDRNIQKNKSNKLILIISIIMVVLPWILIKNSNSIMEELLHREGIQWIVPLGISFYTMQIIAYLSDVYTGKIQAQRNIAKYALFISFFPQLLQGPIPRYEELGHQLFEGHSFDEDKFTRGIYLIIWGFFLKLVIADKAAVVVNTVFDNSHAYSGVYIWVASILYSIELYADFYACTTLARGVAALFGIDLTNNFARPYLAVSVRDFWRRWHISLSTWLRDYIYIPLGGNQKGKVRRYINLLLTFAVSGIWHGAGVKFLCWGLLHGVYQVIGGALIPVKEKLYHYMHFAQDSKLKYAIKRIGTFLLVNIGWIIFRAGDLNTGIQMIIRMFTKLNLWVLTGDAIFNLGLDWKQFVIFWAAVVVLVIVGVKQEQGIDISGHIMKWKLPFRWAFLICVILGIMLFGTYGFGYDAQSFIYGGF